MNTRIIQRLRDKAGTLVRALRNKMPFGRSGRTEDQVPRRLREVRRPVRFDPERMLSTITLGFARR